MVPGNGLGMGLRRTLGLGAEPCGLWDFDTSFGWYWMNPMFGCGFWEPSLVNWYAGSGWIGWRPGRPQRGPPGHPRPGPRPLPGHATAEIIRVPAAVLQNRQMITPQIVSHIPAPPGTMIAQPPFEPNPRTGPEVIRQRLPSPRRQSMGSPLTPSHGASNHPDGRRCGKGKSAACESWFPFRPYSLARCARHDLGRALRPGRIAGRVPR